MKKLRFIVSLVTQDNDYQRLQAAAATDIAGRLGVDLQIIFSDNDGVKQGLDLLDIIQSTASRPDGIVMMPAGTALPHVARAAAVAGIGWAVLGKEADYVAELRSRYRSPVFYIGINNEAIGKIQGQQLAALLPMGGHVLYIQGPAGSTAAEIRTKGMNQTKPKNVDVRMLRGDWTRKSGQKAMSGWLNLPISREVPVSVVAGQNDAMVMGARMAFEEHIHAAGGKSMPDMRFIGCDGGRETGQAWVKSGDLVATIVTPANAGVAVEMMAHAIQAGLQPQERTMVEPVCYPSLNELTAKSR